MMYIFLSADDSFSQHMGVTMASVLISSAKDTFHKFFILDGGISGKNKNKLMQLKEIKDFEIIFINMHETEFRFCPELRFTESAYSRLKIPQLFPQMQKALYLDSDLIIKSDLKELWEIDLGNSCLAAARSVAAYFRTEGTEAFLTNLGIKNKENYFNSGVMLLNPSKLSKINFFRHAVEWFEENKDLIQNADQDILNVLLEGKIKFIDPAWNVNLYHFHRLYDQLYKDKELKILHFVTKNKPWLRESNIYLKEEYSAVLKHTPWGL